MIAIDSREASVELDVPVYVTSESKESEWGQPAASLYLFTIVGDRLFGQPIAGVYLPFPPLDIFPIDSRLAEEFEAWEAARDEALTNFEATLD